MTFVHDLLVELDEKYGVTNAKMTLRTFVLNNFQSVI